MAFFPYHKGKLKIYGATYRTKYSRKDQVKYVQDNLYC